MRDSVAQLVEQYTFNVWALGSSPSRITTQMYIIFKSPQEYSSEGFFVISASSAIFISLAFVSSRNYISKIAVRSLELIGAEVC